ncbi:hypothetical protein CDN98_01380 [Roseateles terrae]|nr:hypothetical protein CDN98_01380 [Roseateles terrae]
MDLTLKSQRGPALPRGNANGVIQAMPVPPEPKDKLAEELKRAGQEECRKAYADMGVLAVVPLARDAVKGKGCRW